MQHACSIDGDGGDGSGGGKLAVVPVAEFSWVEDGIYTPRKAQTHFTPSLRNFPSVALEMVPVLVWLTTALSHPFVEDCQVLPLCIPLSSLLLAELAGKVGDGCISPAHEKQ